MRFAAEHEAPRRVSQRGESISSEFLPWGRCVQCGKRADLVALAEGFVSLGWCAPCEAVNQQPELVEAQR
jgi:hypothetical protein